MACEGLPALFSFDVDTASTRGISIPLHGNALDAAFVHASNNSLTTVVSIDNFHKPGSTTDARDEQVSSGRATEHHKY